MISNIIVNNEWNNYVSVFISNNMIQNSRRTRRYSSLVGIFIKEAEQLEINMFK